MQRRQTKQRQIIAEELMQHPTHPTADELYVRVRERLPRVSLGTVYRNLELLVEEGRACRVEMAEGPKRYDGNTTPHHHVQCERCGATADVMVQDQRKEPMAPEREGWSITGSTIIFRGLCPHCRGDRS